MFCISIYLACFIFHQFYILLSSESDWRAAGERDVHFNYDLETYPLQILTNSAVGSGDKVYINYYSTDNVATGIVLTFADPPQYQIGYCSNGYSYFTDGVIPKEQVGAKAAQIKLNI